MLSRNKWRGNIGSPTRLEYAMKFTERTVGAIQMLHHLNTENGIKAVVFDWNFISGRNHIDAGIIPLPVTNAEVVACVVTMAKMGFVLQLSGANIDDTFPGTHCPRHIAHESEQSPLVIFGKRVEKKMLQASV